MKKITLILLFCFIALCANAQDIYDDFVSESNAVKLQETKGSLLKKEIFKTKTFSGLFQGFSISSAMITDLRSGSKEAYVIIRSSADKASYSSIIDYDELPACIEALDYIINSEISSKPANYVDVFIKTRDALEIGALYDEALGTGMRWQTAITHRKYITNPTIVVPVKRLQELLDELVSAKVLLDEKLN